MKKLLVHLDAEDHEWMRKKSFEMGIPMAEIMRQGLELYKNKLEGESVVRYDALCKDWGIDPEENRHLFEWLKDDPRDERGNPTRALGISTVGGKVFKLKQVCSGGGVYFYFEDGKIRPQVFAKTIGRQASADDFEF